MFRRLIFLTTLALTLITGPARACEVALVIALDVSRSVDREEFKLMRNGISHAFLDDKVQSLIEWLPDGIQVTVTQWGGAGHQNQTLGWRNLSDRASLTTFVEELASMRRDFFWTDTSVSEALLHADYILSEVPEPCRRHVIDVSSDGISNAGPPVVPISLALGYRGVTINGLIVRGHRPDPVAYFQKNVLSGPLPFVEVTHAYEDYPGAMKRKLLRELSPVIGMAASTE